MADLFAFLLGAEGGLGPLVGLGALGLLLVAVSVTLLLRRPADPFERLREVAPTADPPGQALRSAARADKLERYSQFLEPQDAAEFSAIRLKLLQAGYRGKSAVRTYHFSQFALGLGLLAAGLAYALFGMVAPSTRTLVLAVLIPGVVGYLAPRYWVTRRKAERQGQITNGFPDALDMMLVCVEAGQSLDQSIIRVAKEIRAGYPALAEEFETVSHEIKAGKDKAQVLRDMSERAGVMDVASFVTVLVQSATFGTSIAEALRVFSNEMRDKRVMRAEKKANTLPTKMTLATMLLTVPPLLIILIGPSIFNIYRTLSASDF